MTDSTFVEVSKKNEDNYRYDTFTLYFADKSGKRLLKETRNVYYRRTLPKERVVLEQLAKGPLEDGHYATIPENTMAIIGDGSGVTHSLSHASASGIYVARHIVEQN